MTCIDAGPLLARYADDESSLTDHAREQLLTHLTACAVCRTALEEQRETSALLRARLVTVPRPGLVARVSARIDREIIGAIPIEGRAEAGWLGAVNWRAWTVGLAPVAAALVVAAYLDTGSVRTTAVSQSVPVTFEEWISAEAPAALQPAATGDTLIETVLTGAAPTSGDADVR